MASADVTADPVMRRSLLTRAVRLEMSDYPLIPLLRSSASRIVKPWIGGDDDSDVLDQYRSKDLYVARH